MVLRLEWLPTLGKDGAELLLLLLVRVEDESDGGGPAAAALSVSKKLIEF